MVAVVFFLGRLVHPAVSVVRIIRALIVVSQQSDHQEACQRCPAWTAYM
jgi:hypothetical protein